MDPYLEDTKLWPAFHHELVVTLVQILRSGLTAPYRCHIVQRLYKVADPTTQSVEQQGRQEEYIEVRSQSDGRLVTLLDVVSPANKTTQDGRHAYLETRRAARAAGASVVEIDLLLQGQQTIDYSRQDLPDWDYAVTVLRSTMTDRFEIYPSTLQKRLPRFRLPLAGDDRDFSIDLVHAFFSAFEQGDFAAKIDYDGNPPSEVISKYAYRIWEREGCRQGHDQDHWYRAIADLKRGAQGRTSKQ
jgi:hypothetical protein